MKRNFLSAIFFVFISFQFLWGQESDAFNNNQKIWSVDCQVIKDLRSLYMSSGYALPSASGPWSTDELKLMLEKVNEDDFPADSFLRAVYNRVYQELYANPRFVLEKHLGMQLNFFAEPEMYIHTNSSDFTTENDWHRGFEQRSDFLRFEFSFLPAKYFYAGLAVPLQFVPDDSMFTPNFMSNIPGLLPDNLKNISINFPSKAVFAFGGPHWSVSTGRDRIVIGNGESGNLGVGGNQIYDNNFRFSTYFSKFKFSYLALIYPHVYGDKNQVPATDQNEPLKGIKLYLNHRMEGRFCNDRLGVALQESIMYQSADNTLNLSILSPASIFHNYYIRGNANSMMNLEADFNITRGLNIYGQFAIDDLAVPGDTNVNSGMPWHPNKLGYMLGIKGVYPVSNGLLNFAAEGVYTDPYFYLREDYDESTGKFGVSFYGDLRYFASGALHYVTECVGYRYGGDCITGTLKASYEDFNKWKCGAELFYMAHGIINSTSIVTDDILGYAPQTPSTSDVTGTVTDKNAVQHLFRFSLDGSYEVFPWLSVNVSMDNIFIWNKDNLVKPLVYDLQMCIGSKMRW